MTEDQIAEMTAIAVGALMSELPTMADRKEALGLLLMTSYNLLRRAEGDKFMVGWLESALADVRDNQPAVELRMPH